MLTITPLQSEAASRGMEQALVERIGAFLQRYGGDRAASLGVAGCLELARTSIAAARANGVQGQRGLARWAYLQLICGEGFERQPEVAALFAGGANEQAVDALFDELVLLARLRT